MKVLVVGVPQAGHVGPMLPLIRALGAGGDEVVVATAEAMRSTVENAGESLHRAGGGFEKWYERLRARTRGMPGAGLSADRTAAETIAREIAAMRGPEQVADELRARYGASR